MWISKLLPFIFALLSAALLSWGCRADMSDDPDVAEDAAPYLRLTLHFEDGADTRSNPTGGEVGDGRETAQKRESLISSLHLLFYNSDSDDAINGDGNEDIKYSLYLRDDQLTEIFNKENDKRDGYYLIPLKGYRPEENDRVLVFANARPGEFNDATKISVLRDKKPSATWSGNKVNESSNFSMATARSGNNVNAMVDGKIYFELNGHKVAGTKDDPFYISATIERTAARIDFWYPQDNKKDGEIVYSLEGVSGESSKVHITHIRPINTMTQPSWYFKRVTTSLTDKTLSYCKPETPVNGKPGNFVVEPNTEKKSGGIIAGETDLSDWFGDSQAQNVKAYFFTDSYSVANLITNGETLPMDAKGNLFTSGDWESLILAYTNENTMFGKDFANATDYLTGLAFKAIYQPVVVYSGYDSTNNTDPLTQDNNYNYGQTFWRVSPTEQTLSEAASKYFSNEEAANAYKAANPQINGIITKYEGGVCYYNMWIRHANYDNPAPDPQDFFEMEYAIVRNNIYRIGVTFSGPGNPEPSIAEPHHIQSRIFVRKWNLRVHSPIIM